MTRPSDATRALVQRELLAVTKDTWSESDYDDAPERRQMVADIEAGLFTPDVLDEMEDCLSRDWCAEVPRVHRAFLTVLAEAGRLDVFDPFTVYSRRPRTTVIGEVRYVIG